MNPDTPAATPFVSPPDSAEAVDLSGRTLGDFRLLRKLGEGGMGQVYLAEQLSLNRRVALKLLKRELAGKESSRRRFEAEARAVAQLTHPNIVQVFAVGEHEGVPFMALEYVDGRNLREYLVHKGPPDLPLALSILRQVAAALLRAAELGFIHRDIKPENILLTRNGEVKVADFGLTRMMEAETAVNLTQTGMTLGTPLYMSPEQVEGKPLDPRTDLYSLGVSCYHMLAGHPPFEGDNAFTIALQHVQSHALPLEHVRPDLPPELCAVVNKLMAKRPEDRYQTARQLLNDLQALSERLHGASTEPMLALTAPPPPPTSVALNVPTAPGTGRSPFLRLGLFVAGSLVLAAGGGALLGKLLSPSAAPASHPLALAQDAPPRDALPGLLTAHGTPAEQEAGMRVLVARTDNPGRDVEKLREGISHRILLAGFLLKRREEDPRALERAADFFRAQCPLPGGLEGVRALEKLGSWHDTVSLFFPHLPHLPLSAAAQHFRQQEAYLFIGDLGMACVLAFQNQPVLSNSRFLSLYRQNPNFLRTGGFGVSGQELLRQPEFLRQVFRALDYNYRNTQANGEKFPAELQKLRQMDPAKPRPTKP